MPTPRPAPARDTRNPWTRRGATAMAAALLALWGLSGCRQTGPGERLLEPSAPTSNRPVATFGPDDAVVGTDPAATGPAAARPGSEVATPPARSDCGSESPAGRRCTPSPQP